MPLPYRVYILKRWSIFFFINIYFGDIFQLKQHLPTQIANSEINKRPKLSQTLSLKPEKTDKYYELTSIDEYIINII